MNESSVSTLEQRLPVAGGAGAGVALVGTYPPTRCGIATFTASLRRGLMEAGEAGVDVVRVRQEGEAQEVPPEVRHEFDPAAPDQVRRAAAFLSSRRAVIVQHEFGIYGPRSGRAVVDLVRLCSSPVLVTLHTVSEEFDAEQRQIVEALTESAAVTVVLSDTAARTLVSRYGVDPDRVEVIPHGSNDGHETDGLPVGLPAGDPLFLSWGLIGPGKGFDWAMAALPRVREQFPNVHWVVAGETHPKVAAREGESYRRSVQAAIVALDLTSQVSLLDAYLTRGQIRALLDRATAVALPYDSTQQTSSGVLMEAVAAGVPVVATAFPQAVEVADRGGALVVPHRDANALASALIRVAADEDLAARMVRAQSAVASGVAWREVGASYLRLAESPVTRVAS